jgi:L-alanine-DL-glutamate epimerase-like enolase superfamily enzyme
VGGITPWLKVAGMCEAFNLPVVSHLLAEVHVHLVGAVRSGLTVEYADWFKGLYDEPPVPVNGEMHLTDKPGLGVAFDEKVLKQNRIG